jgi:Bacterial Ig-like domain (group 2)
MLIKRSAAVFVLGLTAASCGGDSSIRTPITPTPVPAPVGPAAITVGTAGNVDSALAPGATLQLWATARAIDGTTSDVTNVAVWQSSDPAVATVSPAGLLRATLEGSVTISAVYQQVTGSLKAEIRRPGCEATILPARLIYNAFGGSGSADVTLTSSDCRWTAKSDSSWLVVALTPNVSGTGQVRYNVRPNNTPEPRAARLQVSVAGGPSVALDVSQEKPVSCSYVVNPAERSMPSSGGTGSFEVITTPGYCQWKLEVFENDFFRVTSGKSGTGRATVTYSVGVNTFSFEQTRQIEVRGLSGANPPGAHIAKVAPK